MLGVLPVAAQSTGIQRTWLLAGETSQLADLLFGPDVIEVPTPSTGTTTAGGTVSWIKYREKDDHLGMHHVYYRQQYLNPQLGRSLKVLGTAVSLHYAPDGSLSHANLAQVTDVPPLASVALPTPQQAFAAAQMALAGRPGFRVGSPTSWPPGTLASILADAELAMVVPPGGAPYRLQWGISTLDADLVPYAAIVDAATGTLLGVTDPNPHTCPPNPTCPCCAHCSPATPASSPAKARPENPDLLPLCGMPGIGCGADGYRDVAANALGDILEQEDTCYGTCTYEAVRAAEPGSPGIPQIEVYHGVSVTGYNLHCVTPESGYYMRVGLMPVVGDPPVPTYDSALYPQQPSSKQCPVDDRYRTFAGDAMYYTLKTMEVFKNEFQRCGFDGSCGTARVVVDACGCQAGAQFTAFAPTLGYSPIDSVKICKTPAGLSPASSALDIVAHEWGHGVSKYSQNFVDTCKDLGTSGYPETCEMSEGFADVVGHIVERIVQTLQDDGSWVPEHWDWTAGEDAAGTFADRLRRADLFDERVCTQPLVDYHYSVHAEDPGCEYEPPNNNNHIPEHSNGNRLSVVLKLMTDGGFNPGAGHVLPCTGCDIGVIPLDPDADTSFHMAAQILFRVLDTEADLSTLDWDHLPFLARNAASDLYHSIHAQARTVDAFRAVGYPQACSPPCLIYLPPCCAPDWPCLGEPE